MKPRGSEHVKTDSPASRRNHFEEGNELYAQGRFDEAIAAYRQALHWKPSHAEAYNNMGAALQARGRIEEAETAYHDAVRLKPDYATAWNNLGSILQEQRKPHEAVAACRRALQLDRSYPTANYNLGNALRSLHKLPDAADAFRAATRLKPDFAEAHSNLGAVLHEQEQLKEALEAYQTVLHLKPNWGHAAAQVMHLKRELCDWQGLDILEAKLRQALETNAPLAHGVPPFSMLAASISAADQLRCARLWATHKRLHHRVDPPRAAVREKAPQKLRIGYLSADFHKHATAYLIAGLLDAHDRQAFEIVAYSYGMDDGSPIRARLQSAFSAFNEIGTMSDAEAAAAIHGDGIHILVDLKGYTQHARPGILAYRPAPLQVQFVGYPGTMGTRLVDYLIADSFVVPPDHFGWYDEQIVHMPECYQPNDPDRIVGSTPTRAHAGLPDTGFVFCSFNEAYKITPAVFDIWMRLLQAVPGSVLWLLASNSWATENLRRQASQRGVDPERLLFAPRLPQAAHLGRLGLADLVLDTLPVNAHTTASDALWAGVPVLTCPGNTFVSRVAGSLVKTAGLDELITESLEAYENKALELASQPSVLESLKAKVQEAQQTSALFDAARFASHIESAYRAMWDRHAHGKPPAHITIPAKERA